MSAPQTRLDTPHVHGAERVVRAGAELDSAGAAVILVHGRGGNAADIITLARELGRPDVAYLAPQARGGSWYPGRFLAPIEANEPSLSSALRVLDERLAEITAAGIAAQRTVLAGFSQGACLVLEFAARNARRYGAVIGFTGALIGPPSTPRDYAGTLDGTPVFLGASVPDAHVPWPMVEESAAVLEALGAIVDLRGYPGMAHTINADEMDAARALLARVAGSGATAAPRAPHRRDLSGQGGAR